MVKDESEWKTGKKYRTEQMIKFPRLEAGESLFILGCYPFF